MRSFRPQLAALEDRCVPATFTVANANDSGAGSLRQAVIDAATNKEGDLIRLAASLSGQTIVLSTNDPNGVYGATGIVVTNDTIVIDGSAAAGVTISGANARRLFAITPTGKLSLLAMTLTGGQAQGGAGGANQTDDGGGGGGGAGLGGAIYNEGTLSIAASTLTGNTAQGGVGGNGGPNRGDVTLSSDAGGGGGGGGLNGAGGNVVGDSTDGGGGGGGATGRGGSAVGSGTSGGGGGGTTEAGGDGTAAGGTGGALNGGAGGAFSQAGTPATGPGGGGGGGGDEANGAAGNFGGGGGGSGENDLPTPRIGGAGGFGGGGGGGGEDSSGGAGGFGGGGGGASPNGGLGGEVSGGGGFAGGAGGKFVAGSQSAGGGGGAGLGGAIFNNGGVVILTNSTVTANTALGGAGGAGTTPAENGLPGQGLAGGVFSRNGSVSVINSTFSGNTATGGRQLYILADGAGNTVTAGLTNSIFGGADTTAEDVTATATGGQITVTGTANLIRRSSGFTSGGVIATADPQLGPLAENGGPTRTLLPAASSPALTVGTTTGVPSTDQRGQTRPTGGPIDLGAVQRSGTSPLTGATRFAVGAGAGGSSVTRMFDAKANEVFALSAFIDGFSGGVRTAVADFTGDGVPDLAVGTGPGAATQVKVFDGVTKAELFTTAPFESAFTGGVFVAAGDLTGDSRAELIVTPDEGGGPRVRVFSGNNFTPLNDFFGIEDDDFRGGARAAVGDINGDGRGDLIVAAGFGGGPRVAVFNGAGAALGDTAPPKLFGDVLVFENTLRNGVFVASGDLDGDGQADLIAGGGPGGGPRVLALSGADLVASNGKTFTQLANFFAGDANNRNGIRVAVKNLDGDTKADLIVGDGAGARVTGYAGRLFGPNGAPPTAFSFDAFAGFSGGVFVG